MKKQPSNQQIMQALQKGFEETKKDTDFLKQGFAESKKDVNVLKKGFKELQQNHELILESIRDFAELTPTKEELYAVKDELKDEIEQVKLRQDNVAYRFELNALDKRVAKLETKATC
jgi:archaellum component FlaC